MSDSQQRLIKDFQKFRKVNSFFDECLVVSSFSRDDVTDFRISIIPKLGPFRGCFVRFKLKFNDYPNQKPTSECLTKIFHPNVGDGGDICYSMFGNDWDAKYTLLDYANGLCFLLCYCNHDSPLNSKCVEKNPELYDHYVQNAASGKAVKGVNYDYCRVPRFPQDVKEFRLLEGRFSSFFDHKKDIIGMEGKVKAILDSCKELLQRQSNDNDVESRFDLKKYAKSNEHLNLLVGEMKTFVNESLEDFKKEEFELSKKTVYEYHKQVETFLNLEKSIIDFLKNLKNRFKRNSSNLTIKNFDVIVYQLDEIVWKSCRKLLDDGFEKLVINPSSNMGDKEVQRQIELLNGQMKSFLERCQMLFDRFWSVRVFFLQVNDRYHKTNEEDGIYDLFENNEFKVLIDKVKEFFSTPEFLGVFYDIDVLMGEEADMSKRREEELKKEEGEWNEKMMEKIRNLEEMRKVAEKTLESQDTFKQLTYDIMHPEELEKGLSRFAKITKYVKQMVCTYKHSGETPIPQKWFKCPQCFPDEDETGICEVCSILHEGHEGMKENSVSPGRFFCQCGKDNSETCEGMKRNYDVKNFHPEWERKKKAYGKAKTEISELLKRMHLLFSEREVLDMANEQRADIEKSKEEEEEGEEDTESDKKEKENELKEATIKLNEQLERSKKLFRMVTTDDFIRKLTFIHRRHLKMKMRERRRKMRKKRRRR